MRSRHFWIASLLPVVALLAGCGPDQMETAPVKGKVTMNDQPVSGGIVTFAPTATGGDAGKPASGTVGEDGTYSLTTYETGDGAVVGKHHVMYTPPTVDLPTAPKGSHVAAPPASPYAGLAPQPDQVEVVSGENTIDLKLVKP